MTLDDIALKYGADKASRWHGYAPYYATYFEPLRNKPIRLLEIGVQFCNSIKMWIEYFEEGMIHGIDCQPVPPQYAFSHHRFAFTLGDQTNRTFLADYRQSNAPFDIIVDDGNHMESGIVTSFMVLWNAVKPGGYYVIEDLHASYTMYPGNTMNFVKGLVDDCNWHGKFFHGNPNPQDMAWVTDYEKSFEFLHFYRGMVVIRKRIQ